MDVTGGAKSVEPKAQLARVWGTRGSSRYGVKLVVEPLELLRLPEARGEVPLEVSGRLPGPLGRTEYLTDVVLCVCFCFLRICFLSFFANLLLSVD